jgi:hypothetical protein
MAINGNSTGKFGQRPVQLSLRDHVSLDPTDLLKASMQEAIKQSGLSRSQVVDEMNRLSSVAGMGVRVSEAMLDKWVARGSRSHIIPVRDLPVFCQAVGSILPIGALLPPGAEIAAGDDLKMLRWARAESARRAASKQARKLAEEAGIV